MWRRLSLALASLGLVFFAGAASAEDPHALMAEALEAQADVMPAAPRLPEQAADPQSPGRKATAPGQAKRDDAAASREAHKVVKIREAIDGANASARARALKAAHDAARSAATPAARQRAKSKGATE